MTREELASKIMTIRNLIETVRNEQAQANARASRKISNLEGKLHALAQELTK